MSLRGIRLIQAMQSSLVNSFHNTANRQSIKKQEEVHTEDDEKISYVKLQNYINMNHPTDEKGKSYSICEEIGFLPFLNCCFNTVRNPFLNQEEIEIPRIA